MGYEGGVLEVWMDKAKKVLEKDDSPPNFSTFIRLLRDTEPEYAAQQLLQLQDFSIAERNRLDDLAEENLAKLQEGFKEYTEQKEVKGIAETSQNRRQATIELFQQASKYIEAEREVDWEEIDKEISQITDKRTLVSILEALGDDVNFNIATNIPDKGFENLKAFYNKYSFGEGYQKNYNVNNITNELALVYLTEIQEPIVLSGKRQFGDFAQRGFLANPDKPNVARNRPPAKPFKVKGLPKIQTTKGRKKRFTDLFLSLFKGDLSEQENITNQLAQNLKSRAVNRQAVLDVVSDIAFKINQEMVTIDEANRMSGLNFNVIADLIPSTRVGDKEEFIKDFKNTLFSDGAKGQRDMTRQFENKMTQYRAGVPKLFKDFITDLISKPNVYEDVFNSIYTNSYLKFRQDSDLGGFIQMGTMPGKSGKRVASWKIQPNVPNSRKLTKLYEWLVNRNQSILNDANDKEKSGLRALRKLYRNFRRDNVEDTEEELFGNLLNISVKDESDFLRTFTDPFEKSIASLFIEVKDGTVNLEDLTSTYNVSLDKTINTVDLIQELHETERVVGGSDITNLLTKKYPEQITPEITNEQLAGVVRSFILDLNKVVKKIVVTVRKLIEEKLQLMANNQGKYLPLNNAIFIILEGKGLITEV